MKAFRSGETARTWSDDPYDETVRSERREVHFRFSMPSKGGGITQVELRVEGYDFAEIALAMMAADPDLAIHAFGSALVARQILTA